MAKKFLLILPEWRNFAKSGHTVMPRLVNACVIELRFRERGNCEIKCLYLSKMIHPRILFHLFCYFRLFSHKQTTNLTTY